MTKLAFANNQSLVANLDTYRGIRAFDDGKPECVRDYIIPHRSEVDGTAEGAAILANRKLRLYNINFVNRYLFLHWSHMSQPIFLSGADSDAMKAIEKDPTGFRKSMKRVARERLWLYIRDGRCGTLVDGPAKIATDRETARKTGERSYQVNYSATQIRDWQVFTNGARKGQLSRLVLEQPVVARAGKLYQRYRVFEQEDLPNAYYHYYDIEIECDKNQTIDADQREYEVVGDGYGGLTEIPFVFWGEGPEESFAKDSWQLNRAWMNLNSVTSHIIYNQGFQRIILSGVDKKEVTKMTEYSVTVVSGDGVRVYTIPDGDPVAAQAECDKLKRETHRAAKFEYNQMADDTRQVQSADSKSKDLVVQKVIYDTTLDEHENVEQQIWTFHAMHEGEPPDNIQVSVERDYGLEDPTAEEIELDSFFNQCRELNVPEGQKEVLRIRASRLKFVPGEGESEDDVLKRVMDAIDRAKSPAEQAQANLTGFGQQLFGSNVGVSKSGLPNG